MEMAAAQMAMVETALVDPWVAKVEAWEVEMAVGTVAVGWVETVVLVVRALVD